MYKLRQNILQLSTIYRSFELHLAGMFYWAKSSDMSWQSKVHIETYSLFNKHYSAYQASWLADSDVINNNILMLFSRMRV